MPRISVIMPVYNCGNYIREAVESILQQTFRDFELLIIDDASTDQTFEILKTYADPRIRLIQKKTNSGYPDSLNMGLKMATGEFIARMDGDDISHPERFAQQVSAFESNQELVLCGSFMEIIDSGEIISYPTSHDDIKVNFLKICCIAHPSVMYKRSFLNSHNLFYDTTQEPAEDFHLWVRMISAGIFLNLPIPLLKYRVHENQVSTKKQQRLRQSGIQTKIFHLSSVVNKATATKFYSLDKIIDEKNVSREIAYLKWLEKAIEFLKGRNHKVLFFAEDSFGNFLDEYRRNASRVIFLNSKVYNLDKLGPFLGYFFKHPGYFSIIDLLKGSFKCVLFYKVR